MTAPSLRLESFARTVAQTLAPTASDVAQAWQKGYDQGKSDVVAVGLEQITGDIRDLAAQLTRHAAERDRLRNETITALGPILSAIVDLLGPELLRDRMIEAVVCEIRKLEQDDCLPTITLRCSPELSGLLRMGLKQAGCTGEVIEDQLLAAPTVELVCANARTRFEPDQVLARCRAILHEFLSRE